MSNVADIASIVSAGATCVALVFAGVELRRSRAADRRKRRVEIEGVAVSWVPVEAPRAPQDEHGQASWVYEFTACNPGSLPISDVCVEVAFALPVRRVNYDGHLDAPTDKVVLETPVITGGGQRTWRRRLLLDYATAGDALPRTRALVSFTDPDDPSRTQHNVWPKRLSGAEGKDAVPQAGGLSHDGRPAQSSGKP